MVERMIAAAAVAAEDEGERQHEGEHDHGEDEPPIDVVHTVGGGGAQPGNELVELHHDGDDGPAARERK